MSGPHDAWFSHASTMLELAHAVVAATSDEPVARSWRNKNGERPLGVDLAVEKALVEYAQERLPTCRIFSEESGYIESEGLADSLLVFDPVDGSMNYHHGRGLLEYGTIITLYHGTDQPNLSKVQGAAIIEHSNGLAWVCDERSTVDLSQELVSIDDLAPDLPLPVFIDLYDEQEFLAFKQMPDEHYVRSTGCASGNLSYVLHGVSPCMGGLAVKAEEIGAIKGLVEGAGGTVVDLRGNSLDHQRFDPGVRYGVLAGAELAVKSIVSLM